MNYIETSTYIYYGEPKQKDTKYYGKIYYKNGISYHGYFINGLRNGYGEKYDSNGSYRKGYFKDGVLNGEGVSFNKEKKAYYIGNFTDGKLDGLITCFYDDPKRVIKKNFKDGIQVKEVKVKVKLVKKKN